MVFGGWLPSPSMVFSKFTHTVFFHFVLYAFRVTSNSLLLKSNVIKMYLCLETQMYRTEFWTPWEKARVGCLERTASKHVHYPG